MSSREPDSNSQREGLLAVASAFAFWGIVVVYWKQQSEYNAFELIFHRLLWASLLLLLIIKIRGKLKEFIQAFKCAKTLRLHAINGGLISANWICYVYAVTHGHILEGSLAYFMVPILNTAMGFLILREKLSRLQWISIGLATIGVANEIIQFGKLPWMALIMAGTFAIYGLNKTRSNLGPITALAVETWIYTPVAIVGLVVFHFQGIGTLELTSMSSWLLAISMGAVTIIPLVLFAFGARRIQLTTIGLLQFIAPSIKFVVGVFLYGEPFPLSKLITFCLIWSALLVYLFYLFSPKRKSDDATGS
jgi:chloramphenicol-sensitive protein RarD